MPMKLMTGAALAAAVLAGATQAEPQARRFFTISGI
jgi:hypothetical protein